MHMHEALARAALRAWDRRFRLGVRGATRYCGERESTRVPRSHFRTPAQLVAPEQPACAQDAAVSRPRITGRLAEGDTPQASRIRDFSRLVARGARWSAAVACVWGLASATTALARPVVLVGNLREGTVTVVDEQALKVLGTINVTPEGKTPQDPKQAAIYPALVSKFGVNYVQGVALSPDGRTLYVSRGFLGDVAAFDVASGRLLWRHEIGGVRADHLALSPDGRRLFVSALTENKVEVFNASNGEVVGSFPTGEWPHVLEFTPNGQYIVNGSLGNLLLPKGTPTTRQLTFANPETLAVERVLNFEAGVRPFVFSPDGSLVYVQLSFFNGFEVVNAVTGEVEHIVELPILGPAIGESPSEYPNQAAHHGIALNGRDTMICDAATVSNYVALVTTKTLATKAIIPVGEEPADAATGEGRCFVPNRGKGPEGDSLSVISYAERLEIARLPMGQGPQELTIGVIPDLVLQAAGLLPPRL
jgi:DNA-binding beta-propeller fold protein YncE